MKNKVVIVTGASQGIGREIAINLSENGAKIVLVSRNIKMLKQTASMLNNENIIIQTDIRLENSVKNMVKKTIETFGKIDVLINNAGYVEPAGILEMKLKHWTDMIDTNLTGTFLCTKEVVKYMKKSGGKIINIASTAGIGARPGWSGYAASKAGVISFSLTMAEELRNYNIKVFCICPGRTATNLRKKLAPNEDPTTIMQPESVVKIVKYCFTDDANIIEGQPILVRER